jgi:uncharacterized RDD family membrane protein YckC
MTRTPDSLRSARRGGSPYPKADLVPRLLAKTADLVVATMFYLLVPNVGALAGLIYLLLADAMPNGQSPGKRLLGVKAVHVPTRRACGVRESIVRNLPVALACGIALNPFLLLVALPVLLFELYMVSTDALGVRIGDVFADTQVIDAKVPFAVVEAQPGTTLVRTRAPMATPEVGDAAEVQTRST